MSRRRKRCLFCEVCCHKVYDMGKHIQTFEHERQVNKGRQTNNEVPSMQAGNSRLTS